MTSQKILEQVDWPLLIITILLILFGEIAIYSSSAKIVGAEILFEDFYLKQLIWILIASVIFVLVLTIPDLLMDIFVIPFYVFSILLLLIVLFLPSVKGVHRWIGFGGLSIQPSEIAKISSVLLIAKIISKKYISNWKIIVYAFLIILLPMLLIFLEPDLGSCLIFPVFGFSMIFFAGVSAFLLFIILSPLLSIIVGFSIFWWIIFDLILLIILFRKRLSLFLSGTIFIANAFISWLTPFFWSQLRGYQQNRILSFLHPTKDVLGSGYQIIQSKIAIGSGQIFGKGLLQGTQKNLDFLPAQHTDFIFSVIGEEFGFLGCFILLILFSLLIWRIISIIKSVTNISQKLIIIGILSFLTFQIIVNIGMNLGLFPVVGIPLPFISYGGSALLINAVAIAIITKLGKEKSFI
ncbi:MAG: rod shape-determining protein RodA [Candidatus Cloacimonetes bacterium]|nr:rod shape-determining protein RodA [Candidatus Cloacimonadota bacterium]